MTVLDLAGKKELAGDPAFPVAWAVASAGGRDLGAFLRWRGENQGKLRPAALLRGADLLAMGIPAGPKVKELLEKVRLAQWNEEIRTRAEAEALVKKIQ